MASYRRSSCEGAPGRGNLYLKPSSQLDLAFLRDHKNMLLLEFLDGKGVFVLQQVLANLRFSVSVFLNFAKGMISNYYKSFVVVVSPLMSLIWMKDRDSIMKERKTSYGLKVQ